MRISPTEKRILAVLKRGERYAAAVARILKISRQSVYTALRRMLAKGLVRTWTESVSDVGGVRRFYALTTKGVRNQ